MNLSKVHSCLPINSIQCQRLDANGSFIMYFHEAGRLIAYNVSSNERLVIPIFDNHLINGIKIFGENVAVFGEKSMCILKWVSSEPSSSPSFENVKLITTASLINLDDLILDVTFIHECTLVVGYAHNFIDIFESIESEYKKDHSRRVFCSTTVSLFSMLLSVDDTGALTVYSGSTFGKLIVWDRINSASASTADVSHVFSDHEGVIFRINESSDRSRLASVSDDRTVRVWCLSSYRQLYCGWGHSARVWDVTFVSNSNDIIATSSEDGTVKVWRVGEGCLATLRGHRLSVWRVISVDPSSHSNDIPNPFLISCGNDGTVKTWSLRHHFVTSPNAVDQTALLVDMPEPPLVRQHSKKITFIANSPANTPASPTSPSSADVGDSTEERGSVSPSPSPRRSGVCSVHCHPSSAVAVLVLVDGHIWLADLKQVQCNPLSPPEMPSGGWSFVHKLDRQCANSDITFADSFSRWSCESDVVRDERPMLQSLLFRLIIAHPDALVSHVTVNSSMSVSSKQQNAGIFDVSVRQWRPFEIRTVNAWFLHSNIVLTAAAQGAIKVWELPSSYLEIGFNFDDPDSPTMLLNAATGKGHIATCCCLLRTASSSVTAVDDAHSQPWTILIGDSRGGITVIEALYQTQSCNLPSSTANHSNSEGNTSTNSDQSSSETTGSGRRSLQVIRSYILWTAHRPDLVSDIRTCGDDGFCSLGHNGFVNTYQMITHGIDEVLPIKDESDSHKYSITCQPRFGLTNRISCLSIRTPTKLFLSQDSVSLFVAGFTGNVLSVCDIRSGYILMSVEGGSWKRPHDCVLIQPPKQATSGTNDSIQTAPRVVFASAVPHQKVFQLSIYDSQYLELVASSPLPPLVLHSNDQLRQLSFTLSQLTSTSSQSDDSKNVMNISGPTCVPMQLGVSGFSEPIYCSIFLQIGSSGYLLAGGEGGSVKVYMLSEQLEMVQEFWMPKSIPVKTLCTCHRTVNANNTNNRYAEDDFGLVVAAGGRLQYSLWTYSAQSGPLRQILRLRHHSTVWPGATQDHRILCSSCQHAVVGGRSVYWVVLGDSRGQVTVLQYDPLSAVDQEHSGCSTVGSFEVPSTCPILSCDTLLVPVKQQHGDDSSIESFSGQVICVLGDTSGAVSVWLLGHSIGEFSARCLGQYAAHSMGANSVSVAALPSDASSSCCRLMICSGGDDQALTVCYANLLVDPTGSAFTLQFSYIERCDGASGSALKGVKLVSPVPLYYNDHNTTVADSDPLYVTSVGYDQRFIVYSINNSLSYFDGSLLLEAAKVHVPVRRSIYPRNSEELPHEETSSVDSKPRPLTFRAGVLANVGDVAALDVATFSPDETLAVVAGQGFQTISFTL